MGGRIKVQRIHNVVIGRNRICRRLLHILAPVRRAYQNEAVLVLSPDHLYNLLRIFLYVAPGDASVWFIAYLVYYIRNCRKIIA